jgi:uncharacterized protein (TIGR03437 family)
MFQTVELTVRAGGTSSHVFTVVVDYRFANIHVLTSDDAIVAPQCLRGGCGRDYLVTHADGRAVGPGNPARAGETITFYAVGLGATTPSVRSGEPAPSPSPKVSTSLVNAISYVDRNGRELLQLSPIAPDFAGLVSGYIGLYQLNVTLPNRVPEDIGPCGNGWNTRIYGASFCWMN